MVASPSQKDTTVLITGASGFIAQHIILQVLDAGYRVRGTLRTLSRGDHVREVLAAHGADVSRLEFAQADLMTDAGWSDAVAGCRFVLHVASPVPPGAPLHEDDLIVPARDGTLRVLAAAAAGGVQRVVMTSSIAAVLYGHARDGTRTYTEEDWSTLTMEVGAYEKSKTLAERAAWDFVAGLGPDTPLELCTINPGLVMGPILEADVSTSGELVRKLMKRELPGCPEVGFAVVDVRDVAAAHVAAMETPAAAGQRFVVAIEHASMRQVADILAARYGARGYRIPTRHIPAWLLKTVSIFDKTAALAVQELGKRQDVSNQRARRVLGFKPHGLEDMVTAMADSMIQYGVV